MGTELGTVEAGRLHELEAVIASGLPMFLAVGRALLEINSARLYRTEHSTFEAYCQARWKFTRRHAYRLIAAAEVADDCAGIDPSPTAGQAREMVPLNADQRREVWEAANAGGSKPTAKRLRDLTARALGELATEDPAADEWLSPVRKAIRLLRHAEAVLAPTGVNPAIRTIAGAARQLEQLTANTLADPNQGVFEDAATNS